MPSTELLDDPLLTGVPLTEGYKVLGGVALYQKLGQGGMGAVYKGRHVRLDIDVALKVMVPPAGISPEHADVYQKRFIREARMAAKIDHPNLIRVTDVNAESGVYFLVMQFVDGESAADRLKRKGPLPEAEAVQIVLGAAEGLARAHQTGIVHRDVKPDNIMIDREGGVKVADLGLAKAFQQDDDGGQSMLTQTQHALGTPSYMPPEQFISARSVGPPGDVWALGITLFELLTGQLPWTGSSVFVVGQKITDEPLPELKALRPELSDGVCALIERATQKNPGDRYAHCGEMIGALRDHQHSVAQPVVSLDDFSAEDFPRGESQASPPPEDKLSSILVILEDQSVELTPAVASKSKTPLTETISVEEALRDRQVEDAVLDNNITTAVKRVRDLAGVTAVAAKAAVESLAEQLNAVSVSSRRAAAQVLGPGLETPLAQPTPATIHPVARKGSAWSSVVVPTILFLVLVATAWYLLDQLLQKKPRKAEETQIKENETAKRKAAEQARGLLSEAEQRWSQDHYNRGLAKSKSGDYKSAIADFTKAIELKPDFANAYGWRGYAKLEVGDYKGAIADQTMAIELKPDFANAYSNRGNAKGDIRDYKGAIADHTKAIELKPDFAEAYNNRGVAKYNNRDYKGAIADFERALEINPDHESAKENLRLAREKLR